MKFPPQERFFNFEESEKLKRFFLKACEVFTEYRYIMLPSVELYSPKLYGEGAFVVGSLQDGSLLCLRKDWTVSLARFLSLQKDLELPLRVFYFGNTFSTNTEFESFQVGIELLGETSPKAEVEVIQKIADYLRACGLFELTVSVGHVGIAKGLLKRYGEIYKKPLLEKNFSELSHIPELKDLLTTQGGPEVLQEFKRKYPEFSIECDELLEVYESLKGYKLLFDLSELRPQDYYTGLVFEFFHPSLGYPLAGGGRYDGLYKTLGKELCAVGGAVYLDRLLEL
ncbi:MAG: ATP phosphoribosyltransferase regulatory subunit [Aquificaceae bacterium]